jgi:5'-nucleotidase
VGPERLAAASGHADQAEDEAVVYKTKIAVSAMQVGYEHRPAGQQWLRLRLRDLFAQ